MYYIASVAAICTIVNILFFMKNKRILSVCWIFLFPFFAANILYLPKMLFDGQEYKIWWTFFVALPSLASTVLSFFIVLTALAWRRFRKTHD